ncbi:hypothetical protein Q7C36_019834 [Tachysurus vachellii]|uniref:Uncharacterized protein n=1 Tax=Tachysurus vachellii TaxID=175792 RepID=A0AA88S815_TACVA|nr:hypothetical protein Q7C36_019834 [Tachysurus vachellii]
MGSSYNLFRHSKLMTKITADYNHCWHMNKKIGVGGASLFEPSGSGKVGGATALVIRHFLLRRKLQLGCLSWLALLLPSSFYKRFQILLKS